MAAPVFPTEGDNLVTTLATGRSVGSSTVTLKSGYGTTLAAALSASGFPTISSVAPLRFTLTSSSFANRSKTSIFQATSLAGDVLSGVSVETGSTDQSFLAGDEFAVKVTARALYEIQTAINNLISGSTSTAVRDAGGQEYNVKAYGLVGDGLIFTANGTATTSTLQVFGAVPVQANVGNTISIVGAGTAAAVLKTTITAYSETDLVGAIASSTNTLTLTSTAGSPAVGTPIVVRGAGNSGADLHTTVSGGSGTSLTLTNNATTTVTSAAVILNATFTLATPIVTTVTGAAARCGTDNRAALNTLALSLRPRPQDVYFPTILFPPGNFFFDLDLAANAQVNIGGLTISGTGGKSVIATFDGPTVAAQYLFSASQRVTFRDLTFNWGANSDPDNFGCGMFHSQSAVGLGNGSRVVCFNCIATGSAASLFFLQRDDWFEAHGCHFSCVQTIFHDGPQSAGQAQGMVRIFGGIIEGFGLASNGHLHGLYLRNGVSCDINTTFRNQVATATGFAIQIDGGAGTAASIKIRSKFESTVINGIITADTGTTVIDGSSFATSGTAITCQAAVVVNNCDFSGCGASPINDFTNAGSTMVITGNRFLDNFAAVTTDITAWRVQFNGNYLSQRTSANALSLTTPTAVQAANNWFSDGTYYGQLPTASLTAGFAALAGVGAGYWDTTLSVFKISTGAAWQNYQFAASNVSVNEGNWVLAANAAASSVDGEVYYDNSQAALAGNLNGMIQRPAQTLYSQYSNVTVATTGELTLTGGASKVGSLTLPANFLKVGKVIRVRARGIFTTTGSPGTLRFNVKFGSTNVASAGASTPTANVTNGGWMLDADITVQSVGVSGTVWSSGIETRQTSATASATISLAPLGAAAITINTTTSQAMDITINWGSASQSGTLTSLTIEALN